MGLVRRTISPHAAPLRRNSTEAERSLWLELRSRRLSGYKFRRQWTIGPYIADFCCIEARLIVEVDGGQHGGEADAKRTAWLEGQGYCVLRFWNNEVTGNLEGVLMRLLEVLAQRGPHPSPLPQAGEGA